MSEPLVEGTIRLMRIGLLSDCYRPAVNGIVRFLILHQRALEEHGHQVFLFTWGPRHPADEPWVKRSFGLPVPRPGYYCGPAYSREARELLRTMDILHANQPWWSGWVGVRYGRHFGIPVVLTCHSRYDLLWQTVFPFLPPALCRALLRPPIHWVTERCDRVIVTSLEAARVMHSLGVERPIQVIPIGIELQNLTLPERSMTRQELGLPEDAPVALWVGRLSPEKGVHTLLEALAQPELAEACLLLVGDGPERRSLERCCRTLQLDGRVYFAGEVPASALPAYAALADVFVTASRVEMLPLSVVEALALGLPVVGLDVPWIRAIVRPGVNGLLADPHPRALAQEWGRVLKDTRLRARLAAGARRSCTQFDIRRTTQQLLELYQQVVEERHCRSGAGSSCG